MNFVNVVKKVNVVNVVNVMNVVNVGEHVEKCDVHYLSPRKQRSSERRERLAEVFWI